MGKDVFICYSFDDEEVAEAVCSALEQRGIDVWIAPRDIPGGNQWDQAIIDGIKSSDGVVFLVSDGANQSKQTKREIQLADDFDKPIIPVTLNGTEPSERFKYYLANIQWINVDVPLTEMDYEEIANTITAESDVSRSDIDPAAQGSHPSQSADDEATPRGGGDSAGGTDRPLTQSVGEQTSGIWIPRVYIGFGLAILSALTWGAGNVVTRWTAAQLPETSFDIAVLKYVLAGLFLVSMGLILQVRQTGPPDRATYRPAVNQRFASAAFFKGVNTYSWILASTLIPAGSVATLENLHVVWTTILLALVFGRKVPGSWIAGATIVVTGAALITGFGAEDLTTANHLGLGLAGVSGLTFALFTVIWTGEGERPNRLWQRSMEMGTLLLFAAIMIYPVHIVVSQVWLGGSLVPLTEIPLFHGFVQAINGLIGIGFTYFLMNEALSMAQDLGRLSSLLLAIGLSFAVPFTMIVEFFVLGEVFVTTQWIGVLLFVLGFTAVRSGILEDDASPPAEQSG